MSDTLITLVVLFITFWLMEGAAWAGHKYLMHGPLWFIHKSHHEPSKSWFEINDVYGLLFAALSIGCIYHAWNTTASYAPYLAGFGFGIAAYGAVYFLVHDVLVHRRIHHRFIPQSGYLHRLYMAHKLHHAVRGRDGCVSFGFVLAPDPDRLASDLRSVRRASISDVPEATPENPYAR